MEQCKSDLCIWNRPQATTAQRSCHLSEPLLPLGLLLRCDIIHRHDDRPLSPHLLRGHPSSVVCQSGHSTCLLHTQVEFAELLLCKEVECKAFEQLRSPQVWFERRGVHGAFDAGIHHWGQVARAVRKSLLALHAPDSCFQPCQSHYGPAAGDGRYHLHSNGDGAHDEMRTLGSPAIHHLPI